MIIQVILVAAVVLIFYGGARRAHTVHVQAGKRIALVLFAMLSVFAVLRPETLTEIAGWVGVGRGTDLLLYLLVVVVMAVTFSVFQRFQQADRRFTDLARTVALREAETINRERGLTVAQSSPVLDPDEHRRA